MDRRRQSALLTAVAAVAWASLTTACGGAGVLDEAPSSARTVPVATSTTPAIDPAERPAVATYNSFGDAVSAAETRPYGPDDPVPPEADFAKFALDPARIETQNYIWQLKSLHLKYRGTLPQRHVTVKSIDPKGPYGPSVTLTDCMTADGWELYQGSSDTPAEDAASSVPPPYLNTIIVIKYKGRWAVRDMKPDMSRTCTA